jgi:hypothetical protein
MPDSKHLKTEDSDEEALARFHRAVRDESESFVDMWSLPLETLGALPLFESPRCPPLFSWFAATRENLQLVAFSVSSGSPNTD